MKKVTESTTSTKTESATNEADNSATIRLERRRQLLKAMADVHKEAFATGADRLAEVLYRESEGDPKALGCHIKMLMTKILVMFCDPQSLELRKEYDLWGSDVATEIQSIIKIAEELSWDDNIETLVCAQRVEFAEGEEFDNLYNEYVIKKSA